MQACSQKPGGGRVATKQDAFDSVIGNLIMGLLKHALKSQSLRYFALPFALAIASRSWAAPFARTHQRVVARHASCHVPLFGTISSKGLQRLAVDSIQQSFPDVHVSTNSRKIFFDIYPRDDGCIRSNVERLRKLKFEHVYICAGRNTVTAPSNNVSLGSNMDDVVLDARVVDLGRVREIQRTYWRGLIGDQLREALQTYFNVQMRQRGTRSNISVHVVSNRAGYLTDRYRVFFGSDNMRYAVRAVAQDILADLMTHESLSNANDTLEKAHRTQHVERDSGQLTNTEKLQINVWARDKDAELAGRGRLFLDDNKIEIAVGILLLTRNNTRSDTKVPGLHPSVCWAMSKLLLLEERDKAGERLKILDPMCGHGLCGMESKRLLKNAEVLLCDNNATMLAGARKQQLLQRCAGRGEVRIEHVETATNLRPIFGEGDAFIDGVVCDLPFGRKFGSLEENKILYPALFAEVHRILKPGSRAVFLTGVENRDIVNSILIPGFDMQYNNSIRLSRVPALLFVFEKAAHNHNLFFNDGNEKRLNGARAKAAELFQQSWSKQYIIERDDLFLSWER